MKHLNDAITKSDKLFDQMRAIVSRDTKLTESKRIEKLHKINKCQYIIKTAQKVVDCIDNSPQKAMEVMLDRAYLMEVETLN